MAGGKMNARQKMINLMYLVFIAMLALNMSKEVLTAFGLMDAKLAENNAIATERNSLAMATLAEKAVDQPAKYQPLKATADQVSALSNSYAGYLAGVKQQLVTQAEIEDPTDYEVMDKTDAADILFFQGENLTEEGERFIAEMNKYRTGMLELVPADSDAAKKLNSTFVPGPVTDREGVEKPYMNYTFEGYPLIASMSRVTLLESDVKDIQSNVLTGLLQGQLESDVSMNNYQAIVIPEKTAFFNGEKFVGKVVLGRFDGTLQPESVTVNGSAQTKIEGGQVQLEFPAGAVGERTIKGEFKFKEGDSIISLPIESSYAVIPRPNSATISADKMNVVYRGVQNPMTISFAGIPDNKVNASATGLKRSGKGYVMTPGGGKEVKINVSGTLPDGGKVSDSKTLRIKDLPAPEGNIAGQKGSVKLPRNNVEISTVRAGFPDDFDFKLPLNVTSFKFKVSGQPTVSVNGTKLNGQAKGALRKAKRGDIVQFFDIKVKPQGTSVRIKEAAPVVVELAN